LKYLIHAVKFRWPTQKLLQPPNFPSFSCGPWGGLRPTFRTTGLRQHFYNVKKRKCGNYLSVSTHTVMQADRYRNKHTNQQTKADCIQHGIP